MSWSFFAAMARMSRFCSLVSFFIGSPFVGFSGASRDDANHFFAVCFPISMDNQENRTWSYGANRYPAFFLVRGGITLGNRARVVKDENRSFKANIVLAEVLPVLGLVPFKSHGGPRQKQAIPENQGCQYVCTYIVSSKATAANHVRPLRQSRSFAHQTCGGRQHDNGRHG